jgi:DNA-binding response OmpR family regulator
MNSKSIVIIEDEEDILELLEYHLQKEGFEVIGFLNTKNVEKILDEEEIALLLVDRNLPGVEGSEFVANLRSKGFQTPVIFLSAKDDDIDIENGFLRGGDDYITKPFNINEVILRIKALLKRTVGEISTKIKFRDITLDIANKTILIEDERVNLTKLEFDLLYELIKNKNNVLNRDHLLSTVWKEEGFLQDKTVNVAINRLKKKIDPDKSKDYIKSIWGVGYTIS